MNYRLFALLCTVIGSVLFLVPSARWWIKSSETDLVARFKADLPFYRAGTALYLLAAIFQLLRVLDKNAP